MAARTFNVLATQLVTIRFDPDRIVPAERLRMSDFAAEMQDGTRPNIQSDEALAQWFAGLFVIGEYDPDKRHVDVVAQPLQTELVGD